MSPQDKLNLQNHGTKAIQLLRQVEEHLSKSGCAELGQHRQITGMLQAVIEYEVASRG